MNTRDKRGFALLLAVSLTCGFVHCGHAEEFSIVASGQNTNSAWVWIRNEIEKGRTPGSWERDAKGDVVSLTLTSLLANDAGLDLFSKFGSVQKLRLQTSRLSPELTRQGISSLVRMTNLTSINIVCGGLLKAGVFEEICKMKELRELGLVAAYPPAREYFGLTNLHNLVELRVGYCTNFGDRELSLLTNLPALKSLTLYADGLSSESTNVLHSMTGLTNASVKLHRALLQAQ
jgi:hypothetical protein